MADSYSWLNLSMRATVCAGAINVIKAIKAIKVNLAGCGMRDAELRIPHPASRKVNFYIILCECPAITYGG